MWLVFVCLLFVTCCLTVCLRVCVFACCLVPGRCWLSVCCFVVKCNLLLVASSSCAVCLRVCVCACVCGVCSFG